MLTNVAPIKSAFSLPNNDPAYVLPVDGTVGESFHNNQVLRGAQTNLRLRFDLNRDRTMDCRLLERERTQGYIDAHAGRMAKKKHTILQRETSRVWTPGFVALQKAVNKCLFGTKTREQSQVDIHRHPRLAPVLHGEAANHAKRPTAPGAKIAQFDGNACKLVQTFLSLENHFCCVTRPDHGSGG